ncbi:MAG: hypothetical protein R3B89_30825 [Polyangiaceae bacterium]
MRIHSLAFVLGSTVAACGAPQAACAPTGSGRDTVHVAPAASVESGVSTAVPRPSPAPSPTTPSDPRSETIGPFALGDSAEKAIAELGEPRTRPPRIEEGASGEFVTTWEWPDRGIAFEMSSGTLDGPMSIRGITLRAPSPLKTSRGVGIGMPRASVEKLYQGLGWKQGDDGIAPRENEFLLGTVYGGTMFRFGGDGTVESIDVGAWAE